MNIKWIIFILIATLPACEIPQNGSASNNNQSSSVNTTWADYCTPLGNSGAGDIRESPSSVYIFAGQSNMVGLGQTPASLNGEINNVVIWEGNHWETFKPGKCFGPELQFAIDWSQNHPNETVGFIKYAVGGTSMKDWELGNPLSIILLSDYVNSGNLPVKAILWDQGEADTTSQDLATHYAYRIESFISGWQSLTGAPFIFGETISKQYSYWDYINVEQTNISSWPNVTMIDTSDLTLWGDNLHFDTNSQLELGHRFYMTANPNN